MHPGGPLDKPLKQIGARLQATPDQILLAWAKSKGIVVVTFVLFPGMGLKFKLKLTYLHHDRSSSKESRLKGYISAGDLELTTADIADLDAAGAIGAHPWHTRAFKLMHRTAIVMLTGVALWGLSALRE